MSSVDARGMTPAEVAEYLRISPDRVRAMLRTGELGGIDTAPPGSSKPRFVVLPHHLREYEQRHVAAEPPKVKRHRKRSDEVDYYPD
jgi:excisionase family DNA binding protein